MLKIWWWWCAAATAAAAAAVACDMGARTHKTCLFPLVYTIARRTSFVKNYVGPDCSTHHGPLRHSDRDPGSEERNNLYMARLHHSITSGPPAAQCSIDCVSDCAARVFTSHVCAVYVGHLSASPTAAVSQSQRPAQCNHRRSQFLPL